jgi:CheY-like chemotaxis protein
LIHRGGAGVIARAARFGRASAWRVEEVEKAATQERIVRTIRLDDERITLMLDTLDGAEERATGERRATRYRYRIKALVVHMQQPGFSTPVPYLVPSRNIGAGELAFLHGGFVHPGTRCMIQLITSYGTWTNAVGTVRQCRYVEGNVHEVTAHFDEEIDPAVYCAGAVKTRVLVVEDDPSIARIATYHLEQLNAVVDHAENGQIAVDKATKTAYDLILMDIDMPVMNGIEAVQKLRAQGYSGTIAAATGMTEDGDREQCLKAGCDRYLPKPFARSDLASLLESLREEPLFSSFHDDPGMRSLIQ